MTTTPAPQPNSLQKKMLAMAGQDLDQFMKEMEVVHKTREAEKAAELSQRLARLEGEDGSIAPPGIEVGSILCCVQESYLTYVSRPLLEQCLPDLHLVALLLLLEGFYPLVKTLKLKLCNLVSGPSRQSTPHPCDQAWHPRGYALPLDLLLEDHQCALQHSFPGIQSMVSKVWKIFKIQSKYLLSLDNSIYVHLKLSQGWRGSSWSPSTTRSTSWNSAWWQNACTTCNASSTSGRRLYWLKPNLEIQ